MGMLVANLKSYVIGLLEIKIHNKVYRRIGRNRSLTIALLGPARLKIFDSSPRSTRTVPKIKFFKKLQNEANLVSIDREERAKHFSEKIRQKYSLLEFL